MPIKTPCIVLKLLSDNLQKQLTIPKSFQIRVFSLQYNLKLKTMKTQMLSFAIIALLSTNLSVAQDISPGQVPSVVLNKFTREYPKARDVEWEKEATTYKVEFELGWNIDHEIRYNSTGEITMHSHDISEKDLPEAVLQTLNTEFNDYRVDDVKRIASGAEVVFSMELNSLLQSDLKVVIDQNGKVVSQLQD